MRKNKIVIVIALITILMFSITTTTFAENIVIDDGDVIITPITETEEINKSVEPANTETPKTTTEKQTKKEVVNEDTPKPSATPEPTSTPSATPSPTPTPTPVVSVEPLPETTKNGKKEEEIPKVLIEFLFNKAMAGSTVEVRLNNSSLEQLVLDDEGTARTMVPVEVLETLTFIVVDNGQLVSKGTAEPTENAPKKTTAPLGQKEIEAQQKVQTNDGSRSYMGIIVMVGLIAFIAYVIYGKIKKKKNAVKEIENVSEDEYDDYDDEDEDIEEKPIASKKRAHKEKKQKTKKVKVSKFKKKADNMESEDDEEYEYDMAENNDDYTDAEDAPQDMVVPKYVPQKQTSNDNFFNAVPEIKLPSSNNALAGSDEHSVNTPANTAQTYGEGEITGTYETEEAPIKAKRNVEILKAKPVSNIVFADKQKPLIETKATNECEEEKLNAELQDLIQAEPQIPDSKIATEEIELRNTPIPEKSNTVKLTEEEKQNKIKKFEEMYNNLKQVSQMMKFDVKETTETSGDKNKRIEIVHEIFRENCADLVKFTMSINEAKILKGTPTERVLNFINYIKSIKNGTLNVYDRNALSDFKGIKYKTENAEQGERYVFWF